MITKVLILLWNQALMEIIEKDKEHSLPLSLPVHMSALPPSWSFLPLTQAELGPLFSNSSPFSFSQSIFILPGPHEVLKPSVQASFGPHVVTKLIPQTLLPSSSLLSASLLSEGVEVEEDDEGQQIFRVQVLFHQHSDIINRHTCISLHAFQETEEHRGWCVPQPPLGLCVVSLILPTTWFQQNSNVLHMDSQPHRHLHRKGWHRHDNNINHQRYHSDVDGNVPKASTLQRSIKSGQIQLYYSSYNTEADQKTTAAECVQGGVASSQKQLLYLRAVMVQQNRRSQEKEVCLREQEGEELWLDSNVLIRYHRGPVLIGQPIRVSVSLRSNLTAQLAVIRMKLKKGLVSMVAQRTLSSKLWSVTLEKNQGSKYEGTSIYFHRYSSQTPLHHSSPLQQIVCLSVQGVRRSFDVAMTVSADWWVEYPGPRNSQSRHGTAVSFFSFADRRIFGISAITETNTIINTAILSSQPVSLPVIVLAVGLHEKMADVTSAVTCHSTNDNTIKVSRNCSLLFVDGSESGLGSTCAQVLFQLGALRASISLKVWVPSLPLRLSLSDPVLNTIQGWHKSTDHGCEPVYQRSLVQVLTQFTARDKQSRTIHLLGSSDWFVDVTQLVHDWLRVEDPQIASLNPQNILIGLRPGKTSVHVVSEQWDGFLGRCDLTVTSDPVSLGDLSVQVVSGLGVSITANPAHSSIITSTVMAYNVLYNHHQEASISVWLQFNDDTASLLSTFTDLPFFLHLSSLAETVVLVTPSPKQRILAQGDGGGPLLRAELLVSTCDDQKISSNAINSPGHPTVLARGSGWVRVYLDLDFLGKDEEEEEEEFDFDISDMLIEGDSDIYTSKDENQSVSLARAYNERIKGRWTEVVNKDMVRRNTLERAALMPSLMEDTLYFSSTVEDRSEEEETQGRQELEIIISAVLALFGLFCVLFLANCLPSALRGKNRTRMERNREGEQEEEMGEETNVEEEEKVHDEDQKNLRTKTEEELPQVEIIC
ncbi:transmembrane protein 132C [Gouania willdenowi]|uniref:transmembrane protein 132C n=1 Tax=Gouania willdenowi TaxID=441366 RepID=UPI001054334C|nr:transmembrane protein 132C-like [Gouania willdenowi]